MVRGNTAFKVLTAVIFLALIAYLVFSAYSARMDPLQTAPAVVTDVDDMVETEGYAVREESIIKGAGAYVSVTAADGKHISSGQPIAVDYKSSDALRRASTARELEARIAYLETALEGGSHETAASELVRDLAAASAGGRLDEVNALSTQAENYIFGTGSAATEADIRAELQSTQQRLDAINSSSSAGTAAIYAPAAGIFSSTADGFENVSPSMLEGIEPEALRDLFKKSSSTGGSVGKLVTGSRWYYATIISEDDAFRLRSLSSIKLRFSKTYDATVRMRIEYISDPSNDECTVVFSSDRYMADMVRVRDMTADIIFQSETGLRVPHDAMRLDDDGNTYVYIRVAAAARYQAVEILGETGDYYVCRIVPGSLLHEGAEIVVRANDLFDGKVIA